MVKNQKGQTTVLVLSILVIILIGIWSISKLIIQENLIFYKQKDYVYTQYKIESLNEVFVFELHNLLESKRWDLVEYSNRNTELFNESDSQYIADFLKTNTDVHDTLSV